MSNVELYRNIRSYRMERGMTQQELAEKAGYADKSMIAKIEAGLVDLPLSKIEVFAKIFNVSVNTLLKSRLTRERLVEMARDLAAALIEDGADEAYIWFHNHFTLGEMDVLEIPRVEADVEGDESDFELSPEHPDSPAWDDGSNVSCSDCPPSECTGHCASCAYRSF